MEKALDHNIFNSRHFIWMDFGINHVALNTEIIHEWIQVVPDKIKQLCINPYIENIDEQNADVYYFRGLAYNDLENYATAIEDFNKSIELNPNYGLAYSRRGSAKFNLNNKTGACADWNKAVELGYDKAQSLIDENCQ